MPAHHRHAQQRADGNKARTLVLTVCTQQVDTKYQTVKKAAGYAYNVLGMY